MYHCLICGEELKDYEPLMCCSGRDCGCMGMPIEPPICSKECWDKFNNKKIKKFNMKFIKNLYYCLLKNKSTEKEKKKGWNKVVEHSNGPLSWTCYHDYNGYVYTIYDMMIQPGFTCSHL